MSQEWPDGQMDRQTDDGQDKTDGQTRLMTYRQSICCMTAHCAIKGLLLQSLMIFVYL